MMHRVPRIIDYAEVLQRRTEEGFRSLYHNSGAFAFARDVEPSLKTIAWIGPEDATIRPAARAFVRSVPAPFPQTLASLSADLRKTHLAGTAWIMPMSHWSFELDFNARPWMFGLLQQVGIDPNAIEGRNTADAIAFELSERDAYETFVAGLLANLRVSDFAIVFPGRPVICMLHHHQQLWWQTPDEAIYDAIDAIVSLRK